MHKPVLLQEIIEGLNLQEGDVVVDATFGAGEMSKTILSAQKDIRLIAIDADQSAIEKGKENFGRDKRVTLVVGNFRNLEKILTNLSVSKVDKILFDFGFSSDQIESSGRGFSFLRDEPLIMTFSSNPKQGDTTASDAVNNWSEENLSTVIKGFGEERFASRIAKAIVEARKRGEIKSSLQLAEIVKSAVPAFLGKRIHPATKTFQALRIAVNDELAAIKEGLEGALVALKEKGRVATISFHSLEDRLVKNTLKDWSKRDLAKIITKKPIIPTREEIVSNPRSRSAKLRIAEKM